MIQQTLIKNCFSVRCLQFSSILFNISSKRQFCLKSHNVNPILNIDKLPKYSEITGEVIEESLPILIDEVDTKFTLFEEELGQKEEYSWDNVIRKSDLISDKLGLAWSAVSHLHGVKNNPSLREAYQKVLPNVVALTNKMSQSKPVYKALQNLDLHNENLEEAQNRIIASSLKSARNSGVHLEGKDQEEFTDILQRLAELGTKFMNNVLDSTKAFSLLVEEHDDIKGLPDTLLQLMASSASSHLNKTIDPSVGPWKLSLDMPCFEPFMKHSLNRGLREKLYREYTTRASKGETSNIEIMEEIRQLRKRKANILGFENYAQLSLDNKMAKDTSAVWKMIKDLKLRAKPVAETELNTLHAFASQNGFEGTLRHWDLAFWSERQKENVLSLNEEVLREYFPFPRVLNGLFSLAEELFQIHIKETSKKDIDTWHEDVKMFDIFDKNGTFIASFFLDAYSRPEEKNGGAWMDVALGKLMAIFFLDAYSRSHEKRTGAWMKRFLGRDDSLDRKPIAYLVCNQSPPVGDNPSLMTFREVLTLFHEFGHGLQHMLTDVKYPSAAGINNVEWDAVELPSQFMENWLYDRSTMSQITSHYKTGETLPAEMFEQLCKGIGQYFCLRKQPSECVLQYMCSGRLQNSYRKSYYFHHSKNYHAAMATMRQLYFSALDIELHTSDDPWREVMNRMANEYTIMKPLDEDCFPCAFMHIFAGGYAAGYYSYKWAEVLSADAFSAFEGVGLNNRDKIAELGMRFRNTVLSQGGSRHPEDIFVDFRGRKPSVKALLKSYGLE